MDRKNYEHNPNLIGLRTKRPKHAPNQTSQITNFIQKF